MVSTYIINHCIENGNLIGFFDTDQEISPSSFTPKDFCKSIKVGIRKSKVDKWEVQHLHESDTVGCGLLRLYEQFCRARIARWGSWIRIFLAIFIVPKLIVEATEKFN